MAPPLRVLTVCTGNLCRSPMMRSVLDDALATRSGDRRDWYAVTSAGTQAIDGEPPQPATLRVLAERGLRPDAGARRLDAALIADSDLVLTATAAHRAEVVALEPRAAARTFTLGEFAALAAAVGRPRPAPDLANRARAAVGAAAALRGRVPATGGDLADPMGQPLRAYHRCLTAVEGHVRVVAGVLAPPGRAGASAAAAPRRRR